MKWLRCGLHGHERDCQVELQIMPKLYLGPGLLGRPQLVGLVLAACPTAKNGVAVTRDYQASAS